MDYSKYSTADFNIAFEQYYTSLTFEKHPGARPCAYLLGGQGGSGKSTLHELYLHRNPNTIIIDGDRFRERHPNFEIIQKMYNQDAASFTQSFVNNLVGALIEKLSDDGYNLVIEGTCRRSDVPMKTCNDLKEKGYRVELSVMCTDAGVAWQSTIDRYNAQKALGYCPRAVPFEKYEETVKALPNNISTLFKAGIFDDITLYNRKKECLYRYTEQPNVDPGCIVKDKLYEFCDEADESESNEEDEFDCEM